MAKVLFFGYGANRDRDRIKNIIGREPDGGYGAVVEGYGLGVQSLEDIPEPAKSVLSKVWGDGFKAYTMVKGEGQVAGVIWELEESELEAIEEFEFVGQEWHEQATVDVKTHNGKVLTVLTEKIPEGQPYKETVDGLNYENMLNDAILPKQEGGLNDLIEMRQRREARRVIHHEAQLVA